MGPIQRYRVEYPDVVETSVGAVKTSKDQNVCRADEGCRVLKTRLRDQAFRFHTAPFKFHAANLALKKVICGTGGRRLVNTAKQEGIRANNR
jgi:hypothetical protein